MFLFALAQIVDVNTAKYCISLKDVNSNIFKQSTWRSINMPRRQTITESYNILSVKYTTLI